MSSDSSEWWGRLTSRTLVNTKYRHSNRFNYGRELIENNDDHNNIKRGAGESHIRGI